MQLQLQYTNCTTPQLQPHYTTNTTTAALHHATSSSCGWGDRLGDHCNHCNYSKKHNSNHLLVRQWIRSAIRDSQQPSSPIGFLFWNFRHRLVRYYWYCTIYICSSCLSHYNLTYLFIYYICIIYIYGIYVRIVYYNIYVSYTYHIHSYTSSSSHPSGDPSGGKARRTASASEMVPAKNFRISVARTRWV